MPRAETYNVTYVPLYDVFVVTGLVDGTDIYGVTDFAISQFPGSEDVLEGSSKAIAGEWNFLNSNYDQSRWA